MESIFWKHVRPVSRNTYLMNLVAVAALSVTFVAGSWAQDSRRPDRELGYFNGNLYEFSASDWLHQSAPLKVQSEVFVVVYPIGWEGLGLAAPYCNPCDHAGNGLSFDDFHDHVLDSLPSLPGWSPLRHVNVVLPNYSFLAGINDPARDAAISAAYGTHFPVTSVAEVETLLGSTAPDGSPLAIKIDAGFYIRVSTRRSRT